MLPVCFHLALTCKLGSERLPANVERHVILSLLHCCSASGRPYPTAGGVLFLLTLLCVWCRNALESVQGVALEAVMPMFKAMVEAAEDIILRLHSEDFGQERQQGMTQASAYMQALITHVNHCRSEKAYTHV